MAIVTELLNRSQGLRNGWADLEPADYFNESGRTADTSDAFNTAFATWCFGEAINPLERIAPTLALRVQSKLASALDGYIRDGFDGSESAASQLCETRDYFRYTDSRPPQRHLSK